VYSRRSTCPSTFPSASVRPLRIFTWRSLPRDLAKAEHAFACRPCVMSHRTPSAKTRIIRIFYADFMDSRGEISRWTKTVRKIRPPELTATDGECCRTDADARSGYQTPTSHHIQKWMVQTRQNNPLPALPSPSARTARLSRQQREPLCTDEITLVTQKTVK